MDYAHKEYEARFAESLALMVFKLCDMMLIILVMFVVYIQILEETPEGMVVVDGTERHWPRDLVLYR